MMTGYSHQQILCKRKNRECEVGKNQCCRDLVCKQKDMTSFKTTCQASDTTCRAEDQTCNPDRNSICCPGFTCERSMLGVKRCKKFELCKNLGVACTPGLSSECCTELTCQRKPGSILGHECQLNCKGNNERCTAGVIDCCFPYRCKQMGALTGTVCHL
ncbi:uncharacterized protein LOC106011412 [Aplysia californica]|uniref:Uncharacterized protein LOC106011412 n=1 Tax=Aplysia californica TaxID=6500 RepID=A0ABM0ZXB2_APLCA|nr:uncharacterized protein LOC106011412 [Aplysia californica]